MRISNGGWMIDRKPSSFTDENRMPAAERQRLQGLMAKNGVRAFPYPFASAISAVSDVDHSRRSRYRRYIGMIVDELGLDFGDSTWLHHGHSDNKMEPGGFGFFSPDLTTDHRASAELLIETRTFSESIEEYHCGNVDHFHSFLPSGPRLLCMRRLPARDGRILIKPREFRTDLEWGCVGLSLFGVCVVGRRQKRIHVDAVTVGEKNGTIHREYRPLPFAAPPNGRQYHLFARVHPADRRVAVPAVNDIDWITIELHNPEDAANVEWVFLHSTLGEVLLNRLQLLRDKYNVGTTLVTEHQGRHFRGKGRAERSDAQLAERFELRGPIEAWSGRLIDDNGELIFSTDADDPHSFARVLPELVDTLEARFVVPMAAHSPRGFDAFELVTPTPTRVGAGMYFARRVLPNIRKPAGGARFDGTRSRADSFAPRLARVLKEAAGDPGLFWPIYTHLGRFGLRLEDEPFEELPSPYFDREVMLSLQDKAFDISGSISPNDRIWFTRASILYDYALMSRSIADHVERPVSNIVLIRSWMDPVLHKRLPRAPAQLHGLTFYVEDPEQAEVRLDGRPLGTLTRNGPDQTGRPSVTIAESEIRSVIFEQLDPTANLPETVTYKDASWAWFPANPSFGRLLMQGGDAGAIHLPLYGLKVPAAQFLTFAVNCDPGTDIGLLLETVTGGRFYFGGRCAAKQIRAPLTARYLMATTGPAGPGWRSLTAPFYAMQWAADAPPGGPMPNHPLQAMTILCSGPAGSGVGVRSVALLRPRATALSEADRRFCLSGSVPSAHPGQPVYLADPKPQSPVRAEVVDQHGFFCFPELTRGTYRLWSGEGNVELHDRRGLLVEVGSNVAGLTLERRVAA
jgi:hypothetical protein